MSKERIRIKQTKAEIRNKMRLIVSLEKRNQPVPKVIYDRLEELNERLKN